MKLVALLSSLTLSCAASTATRAPTLDPPRATEDAAAIAVAPTDAAAAAIADVAVPDFAALSLALMTAPSSEGTWADVSTLRALGSRRALQAHAHSIVQRRTAAMSAEERANVLAARRAGPRSRGRRSATGSTSGGSGYGAGVARSAPTTTTITAPAQTSATNNQVAGVDEGDIVKAQGNDVIVLRRGHLFRMSIANGGLRRVGHAPAHDPRARPGDWYDEMLLDGDTLLVLGYNYRLSATEFNRFRLMADGSIRFLDVLYLRSDDYFSSENYASRIVGGRLVVYTPIPVMRNRDELDETLALPQYRVGARGAWRDPVNFSRIFVPSNDASATTLHAVFFCDVHQPTLRCASQGVLGSDPRTFYVSNTAAYVWTEGRTAEQGQDPARSHLVRLPLSEQEPPGAVLSAGFPIDQFSFDERGDTLRVVVRSQGSGDGMWRSELAEGTIGVISVPLARLRSNGVTQPPPGAYASLMTPSSRARIKNRWIESTLLYGTTSGSRRGDANNDGANGRALYVYRPTEGQLYALQTPHSIDRIEALGPHAFVAGSQGNALQLTAVSLDATPRIASQTRIAESAEGETRSHGFFFLPSADRAGLLGLATAPSGRARRAQLRETSSGVSFFRLQNLTLSAIGALNANPQVTAAQCSVSCVDWYGNTRPVFWNGRVFALLGEELVEGTLSATAITERARVTISDGVTIANPSVDEDE